MTPSEKAENAVVVVVVMVAASEAAYAQDREVKFADVYWRAVKSRSEVIERSGSGMSDTGHVLKGATSLHPRLVKYSVASCYDFVVGVFGSSYLFSAVVAAIQRVLR